MQVLITGGAGFIGSQLIELLLDQGNEVACVDNFDVFYDPAIKRSNIEKALKNDKYHLLEGDIRDKEFMLDCFNEYNFDTVVHLAARAGVRPSIEQPELYFDVNINGTLCLLEVMKEQKVSKLVFISSSSVYGNNPKVPFSEADNVDHPISPYAASKKSGELLCHTYHHLHDFDIFCLRLFTVYGPRQRPEMAIHYFANNILDEKEIKVFGNGSSKRDYTYIEDILAGISSAINKVKGFEVINLGESQTIELSKLITLLENNLGKSAIIDRQPLQPGDVDLTYADIEKAKQLLDYDPNFLIEKGIEKFVNWLKQDRLAREKVLDGSGAN